MRVLERGATMSPHLAHFDFDLLTTQDWPPSSIECYAGFHRPDVRACSLSGARFDGQRLSGAAAKLHALARLGSPGPDCQSVVAVGSPLELSASLSGARFSGSSALTMASRSDSPSYLIGCSKEERRRQNWNRQWRALVLNPHAELTADALTRTAQPVFEAMLELGDWAIDLSGLCSREVNGVHLAVVLRATLRLKETTKGWDEALQVAREALRSAGLDERRVLSGLIKK